MQTFTVVTEAEDGDEIKFTASGNVSKGQTVNV